MISRGGYALVGGPKAHMPLLQAYVAHDSPSVATPMRGESAGRGPRRCRSCTSRAWVLMCAIQGDPAPPRQPLREALRRQQQVRLQSPSSRNKGSGDGDTDTLVVGRRRFLPAAARAVSDTTTCSPGARRPQRRQHAAQACVRRLGWPTSPARSHSYTNSSHQSRSATALLADSQSNAPRRHSPKGK